MASSEELQKEGLKILELTQLTDRLSEVGEAHLVGNIAFATTTKPDIDIQIYPIDKFDSTAEKVKRIFESLCIRDVIIRKLKISKKTLILGKFDFNNKVWNIDVALTNKSADYKYDSYRYFLDKQTLFTEEKRDLIVKLKKEFSDKKIGFDNPAFYIYKGVLEEGISTTNEMEKYLKNKTREIKRGNYRDKGRTI